MASRPRRKCVKSNKYVASIPDEYLVGYVEDGENIDMIMKKFEVLEQLEKENTHTNEQGINSGQSVLSEEQLKDVFRLTSNFTAESAMDDDGARTDMEFYYDYFTAGEGGWNIGDDYFAEDDIWEEDLDDDDYDESFFSASDGTRKRKRSARSVSSQTPGNKFISCEVTGEDGFLYTVRKKVKNVDPNLPVYTRIPPDPIPLSWAQRVVPFAGISNPTAQHGSKAHWFTSLPELVATDLAKFGCFQGILMDPPWQLPNEPRQVDRLTPEQFAKVKVTDKVIPKGLIFIWVPKELIPQVVNTMGRWGFLYVENLVWVKKSVNNKMLTQPYKYFSRSKESLLIFRKFCGHSEGASNGNKKEWQLELRHQRNPDVVFDFVRPKYGPAGGDLDKPEFVYHVIETLLPEANFNPDTGTGMLLELWGKPGLVRKGWTRVGLKDAECQL